MSLFQKASLLLDYRSINYSFNSFSISNSKKSQTHDNLSTMNFIKKNDLKSVIKNIFQMNAIKEKKKVI